MNIIDAVKSGKRARRLKRDWDYHDFNNLTREDILATDWEIEERKIEITESDFDEALSEAEQMYGRTGTNFIMELKKRLFEK